MNYLLARLQEPSTYAGFGVMILGAFGLSLPEGEMQTIMLVGMVASGLAAVLLKEGRVALTNGDAVKAVETAVAAAEKGA